MSALPDAFGAGPFFGLRTRAVRPEAAVGAGGYVPLSDVYGRAAESAGPAAPGPVWTRRVEEVAARLGTAEPRVAASIVFQGLAARLWSVALGSAALTGRIPVMSATRLHWNPALSAPDDLWLPGLQGRAPGGDPDSPHSVGGSPARRSEDCCDDGPNDGLARALAGTVLDGHLLPLIAALRTGYRLSERLLLGNAASALDGALRVLVPWCHARGAALAQERASRLVAELLTAPPLIAGGRTGERAGGGCPAFRRGSCCLYYRVPGAGLCGDCVLDRPPARPRTPGRG